MESINITKAIEIDYGHSLPSHSGFCSQIHGHRGRIEVSVSAEINKEKNSSSHGMVMDFKFLKEIIENEVHDKLDHGFAIWKEDKDLEFIRKRNKRVLITHQPPTAECLAKWAYEQIKNKLPNGVSLEKVTWQETPNSKAEYYGK